MWHRLIEWHHRVGWSGTLAVVRDGLSLGLAALGTLLAYLAIKLGKQQAKIAEKQTAIAEKQDRIMQEQLAKKSAIRLGFHTQNRHEGTEGTPIVVVFAIKNEGNRSAEGCMWEILWPAEHQRFFWFIDEKDHELPFGNVTVGDNDYFQLSGHYKDKLFPGGVAVVARLHVRSVAMKKGEKLYVWWRVTSEDGITPEAGLGDILLTMGESYFAFQKELRVH